MIGRGLFASAALFAAQVLVVLPVQAADRADVFAVSVPVDATAANANAARDTAQLDGQKRAYVALLERLTLASDHARLPAPTDAILNDAVQAFEVANERRSNVRYLADYTFHFRPEAIERLLRDQGIPFAETPSKPLLVLAVLEAANGPVLWDDPNPWRDAWAHAALPTELVPLRMPLGEVEDVTAIDAASADKGDDPHLQAISANYGNGDVLVTRATMRRAGNADAVDINTTRFVPSQPGGEQSWVTSFTANAGESDQDFLARAVARTIVQVEEAWKQANIIDYSQAGDLVVTVPASDLPSWIAVRSRLATIPSIQRMELIALDRQRALVALHYVGDTMQLRLALAQHNLDLTGDDPNWVLQRRGAASAPADNAAPSPAADQSAPAAADETALPAEPGAGDAPAENPPQ